MTVVTTSTRITPPTPQEPGEKEGPSMATETTSLLRKTGMFDQASVTYLKDLKLEGKLEFL